MAIVVDPLLPGATTATGIDTSSLIATIVVGALALGIYKESRFAAVTALVVFMASRAFLIVSSPKFSFLTAVVILVLLVCYVHALRGAFALHELRQAKNSEHP